MVMTEWMKCVKEALKTVPKNTPNRLKVAMGKAKLTYKKTGSTSSSKSVMKKTFKRRNSRKGRKGKGTRRSKMSKRQRGGAMTKLNPAEVEGKNVGIGTSGVKVQFDAVNAST
jgi:hypothetical protein